jgi:hypothetical protein
MDPLRLGFNVASQGQDTTLTLDAYPVTSGFLYGPQPPNLNSEQLILAPSRDRNSHELGPSLFVWTLFDKLTICEMPILCFRPMLTEIYSTRTRLASEWKL